MYSDLQNGFEEGSLPPPPGCYQRQRHYEVLKYMNHRKNLLYFYFLVELIRIKCTLYIHNLRRRKISVRRLCKADMGNH